MWLLCSNLHIPFTATMLFMWNLFCSFWLVESVSGIIWAGHTRHSLKLSF